MDRPTIERLARPIPGASRRRALQTALAGAAAATAGTLSSGRDGAANKKRKKRCKPTTCQARALGAACKTTLQCCPNETNRICAFGNGLPGPICCGVLGATCTSPGDCCGGFVCFEGRCVFAG